MAETQESIRHQKIEMELHTLYLLRAVLEECDEHGMADITVTTVVNRRGFVTYHLDAEQVA